MSRTPPRFAKCPFCGSHPHHGLTKIEHCQLHGEPFQRFKIHCPKGHATVIEASEEIATEIWNTRIYPEIDIISRLDEMGYCVVRKDTTNDHA